MWLLPVLVACGTSEVDPPRKGTATDGTTETVPSAPTPDTTDPAGTTPTTPDPCAPLLPLGTPGESRAAIQACLDTSGHAVLGDGVFEIDGGLVMPVGGSLSAATSRGATLRLTETTTNFLLRVQDDATITGLVLDGNDHVSNANGAVVHFVGSRSTITDCFVGYVAPISPLQHVTAVYFISSASSDNVVSDSEIAGTHYGAIFVAGLDSAHVNTLERVTLHDTRCDGVTFAGYGELLDSELYHHGSDCENGPVPGASIYALNNEDGAYIARNTLYEDCGAVIDLDRIAYFTIEDNVATDPGYTFGGQFPYCSGTTATMVDSHDVIFRRNIVANSGGPGNVVGTGGDPNGLYGLPGDPFGDLPAGGDTTIGFLLANRPGSPGETTHNTIEDNELRSFCSPGCTGLGYFATRGTGYAADGTWSAATTSYYRRNNPNGSNVGSARCGYNWYAANDVCTGAFPEGDCNADDSQHAGDWARNDGCAEW